MELRVLEVPGCPSAPVLVRRLAEVLADRAEVTVVRRVIADADEAARWGMHGSPTLLAEGRDLFPVAGAGPAVACRPYRSGDGRLEGAPTVAALRQALALADSPG